MSKASSYQGKKNSEAVKALNKISEGITCGELDVEFIHLRESIQAGIWMFRVEIRETEKYSRRRLSKVSSDS